MRIKWLSDGDNYFAYVDGVNTGYWIKATDGTARLHAGNKPLESFSQLAHAKEAAEADVRRG